MDEPKKQFCPSCNKVVAPYERDKVFFGNDVFHRICWNNLTEWAQKQIAQSLGIKVAAH